MSSLNLNSTTWNGGFGQPLTISFSFFSTLPNYYLTDPTATGFLNDVIDQNTVEALNPAQQQAFFKALLAWESVANITFEDKGVNNSSAAITVAGASFKWSAEEQRYFYAATQPIWTNTAGGTRFGDMWLNTTHDPGITNQTLTNPGQDGYQTILHEIGHALGLDHPNNNPYSEDELHTTMSYNVMDGKVGNGHASLHITQGGEQWYPSAPMLYDILAIQTMYGVNAGAHYTDDNYVFSNDADNPDVQALWDAGGTDTFDADNQTESVFINLTPGEFSSIGTGDRNKAYIAIAYQVAGQENNWIENAIGGSGDDTLTGNKADNELTGGKGNDTLVGGVGNDTYIYATGDGTDTITDHEGNNQIKIDGTVVSGEFKPTFDGGHDYFSADKSYGLQLSAGGTYRLLMLDPNTHEYKAAADSPSSERVKLVFPTSATFINMNGSDYKNFSGVIVPGVPAPRGVEFGGGTNKDSFRGTDYSDIIGTGDGASNDSNSNYVNALYGNDQIKGGTGHDYIIAGPNAASLTYSDNDIVYGGAQTDVLLGGSGATGSARLRLFNLLQ
ncbi:M10 family metallopeptidase [Methylovulum psychrotolerans]|uniref:Serralysin C n=1 Tax=Methylovulum psychrotolerans TaxID=1704499 RepID=A0A2S5CLN8_9GAMM|nr:M10 family metallopeptidase [Methylovulum psychrotolerans]POZ51729.1 Serralysin C [Methylovulum psychrotolerans]